MLNIKKTLSIKGHTFYEKGECTEAVLDNF